MRLTFMLDRLNLGGAERHCMTLARAMAARGHLVQVIVLFDGGSPHFPVAGFPVPPAMLRAKSLADPRLLPRLHRAIRAFAPDRVMAVNQTALVAASLARWTGARTGQLWCRFSTTLISSRVGRMKLPVFRFCLARADGLIFVSQRQRAYWQARGLRAARHVTILNGIDTAAFGPPSPAARAAMRDRFGLPEGAISITLLGRLAPEKNHLWLIDTLAALTRRCAGRAAPIRLVFIGEGPTEAALRAAVAARDLTERVVFAGAHGDIRPLLAQADCGILVSSAVETLPHAALEMMGCGLPMVMTAIGGAEEIIRHGVDGLLVPPGDTAALQDALLAMTDPATRHRMGGAARERVRAAFDQDRMFDLYEAALTAAPAMPTPAREALPWLS